MAYLVVLVILVGVASLSRKEGKKTVQATVQVNSIRCLALPAAAL